MPGLRWLPALTLDQTDGVTIEAARISTKRFFQLSVFTLPFNECPRLAQGMLMFLATHATHATLHSFLPRFARGGLAAAGETG